jgi:hypothetical protein
MCSSLFVLLFFLFGLRCIVCFVASNISCTNDEQIWPLDMWIPVIITLFLRLIQMHTRNISVLWNKKKVCNYYLLDEKSFLEQNISLSHNTPSNYYLYNNVVLSKLYAKILPRSERHITRPKGRIICLSDLGNILAYYLDKTTLISLLYWVSNCPGNMPKYYPGNMSKYDSTKYHYRNLYEV